MGKLQRVLSRRVMRFHRSSGWSVGSRHRETRRRQGSGVRLVVMPLKTAAVWAEEMRLASGAAGAAGWLVSGQGWRQALGPQQQEHWPLFRGRDAYHTCVCKCWVGSWMHQCGNGQRGLGPLIRDAPFCSSSGSLKLLSKWWLLLRCFAFLYLSFLPLSKGINGFFFSHSSACTDPCLQREDWKESLFWVGVHFVCDYVAKCEADRNGRNYERQD